MMSQRTINQAMILAIIIVIISMVYSSVTLQNAILAERQAQDRKTRCEELGQTLADASDYLTEEVRKFVITENKTHFYNYWDEVTTGQRRDSVIRELKEMELLPKETELLEGAKAESDALIHREAESMALEAELLDMEIPKEIQPYFQELERLELTEEEMRMQAILLLFDNYYTQKKNTIHQYVEDFQTGIDTRMNAQVEEAKKETARAILLERILQAVAVCLVMLLVGIIFRYVLTPVQHYVKCLEKKQELDIQPGGTREIRLLGEAIRKMYDDMLCALNARSQFLAVMSHEIRTPIHSMAGYEFLLEQTELDPQQKKYADNIQSATKHLLALVNQILDFTKLENQKFEVEETAFDIRQLQELAQENYAYQCEQKGVFFQVQLATTERFRMWVDGMKVKQILDNLLSNAVKFTTEGSIRVVLALEKGGEGAELCMQVEDTGIGIGEEQLERIFHSFEQADASVTRRFGGTGLGLSICRDLAELMGGTIGVSSTLGCGSVFTVRIPVKRLDNEEWEQQEKKGKWCYPKAKVLLTDDNAINRRMLKEILQFYQLAVDTAADGREALDCLERKKYDLIFMDIRMPGMNGYEVAQQMRIRQSENQNSVMLAMTADAQPEVYAQAERTGMDGVLTKPVGQEELEQTLQKYLKNFAVSREEKQNIEMSLPIDAELYQELLVDFESLHADDFAILPKLAEQEKWNRMQSLLHELKGVCGNIRENALWQQCIELEEQCKKSMEKREEGNERQKLAWQLRQDAEVVFERIRRDRESADAESEDTEQKDKKREAWKAENRTVESEEWQQSYVSLCKLLQKGDFSASQYLDQKMALFQTAFGTLRSQELRERIRRFDYAGAETILKGERADV